jgi:Domain of unknown function DUF1828
MSTHIPGGIKFGAPEKVGSLIRINTPFTYDDGTLLDLWMEEGGTTVTDMAEAYGNAVSHGLKDTTEGISEIVEEVCKQYGCTRDQVVLRSRNTSSSGVANLIQASLDLNAYLRQLALDEYDKKERN